MVVEWHFLAVPLGCLRFVIVVHPDHTHYYFLLYLLHDFTYDLMTWRVIVFLPLGSIGELRSVIGALSGHKSL